MLLTDVERAYIAGIFDGEGTVSISPSLSQVSIEITNTDRDILLWIESFFPFKRCTIKKIEKCKQAHRIYLSDQVGVRNFIRSIEPFVRIKREQLLIALSFIATMNNRGEKLALESKEDIMLRRAILKIQLRDLNRRGDSFIRRDL